MGQQLIHKTSRIPALYAQENESDPMVHVKLFTNSSSWTWLLTEYSPDDDMAFGFCYNSADPQNAELGYVSLAELRALKNRFGIALVERDIHFQPCRLSEAKKTECTNLKETTQCV